jgi:hypothetical protein
MCQVYTLARLTIDSNLHDTLKMGDGLLATFKRRVYLHIMLYDRFMNVDDYLVVMVNVNHYLFCIPLHDLTRMQTFSC